MAIKKRQQVAESDSEEEGFDYEIQEEQSVNNSREKKYGIFVQSLIFLKLQGNELESDQEEGDSEEEEEESEEEEDDKETKATQLAKIKRGKQYMDSLTMIV